MRWLGSSLVALCLSSSSLPAADLAPATVAKFLRVIVQGTGVSGVACDDKEIEGQLTSLGVTVDAHSRLVWTENENDIRRLAKTHHFVVCGSRKGIESGAVLALTAENGHPVMMINPKALKESGLALPDSVLKLTKMAL